MKIVDLFEPTPLYENDRWPGNLGGRYLERVMIRNMKLVSNLKGPVFYPIKIKRT